MIEKDDVATFILGTKAKTLKRLQRMVSFSEIKTKSLYK